jgi:menaquinone-dependent protoporphyrinogen IX oxidase
MNALVVYYSHSGNNEKLAYQLKERLSCDIHKISELKERKTISILFDSFIKHKLKLSSCNINLKEYDKVNFVAPIWGCKIASPMREFMNIEKNNLEKYFFITLCNGEIGQKEKVDTELYSILHRKPNEVKELWINSLLPEEKQNKIKHTFNFRIKEHDLECFSKDIELFIRLVNDCKDVI